MALNRTVLVALAVFCFSQAALVKRETTGSAVNDLESALSTLGSTISEGFSNFTQVVGLNLPSAESVQQDLHTKTQDFARTLGNFVGQLQNEAGKTQGDLKNVLEGVATKWNETAASLQSSSASKSAQELKEQAQASLNTFLEETRKISNALGSSEATEGVRNVANQAITNVSQIAQEFRNSLHAAATQEK